MLGNIPEEAQTSANQRSTRPEANFSWSTLWSVLEARAQRSAAAGVRSVSKETSGQHPGSGAPRKSQ